MFYYSFARIVRIVLLLLIFVFEVGALVVLSINDHFYVGYFSYQVHITRILTLFLLILSNFYFPWFKWQVAIAVPYLLGNALYLSIGVTVLTFFRPQLLNGDGMLNGVAMVQLGDWLYHQLPFIEAVILSWVVFREFAGALHTLLYGTIRNICARWAFTIFICSLHLFMLVYYVLFFDWDFYYYLDPVDSALLPIWLMIVAAVITTALVLVMVDGVTRAGKHYLRHDTLFLTENKWTVVHVKKSVGLETSKYTL